MSDIRYAIDAVIDAAQFRDVLVRSTLGERRPIDDAQCLQGMLQHADIVATAWDGNKLIGVSRSLTDWNYACYLSDLAVDVAHQRRGIGKRLIDLTQQQLGPLCKIILLAAPAAKEYYEKIGFDHNPRVWMLDRTQRTR
ncbi:MAG: family acetyltransferase [Verrucomicrobiaceae bacterium]|nr:family acetyltransferase [Verrucomicrobiaceae bacterium]